MNAKSIADDFVCTPKPEETQQTGHRSPDAITENHGNHGNDSLAYFLSQWDQVYRTRIEKIALFKPSYTATWSLTKKQQFCRLFYHVRGHFYRFLWLLGNTAPTKAAKSKIIENIQEEFGGNGLSHESLYELFARALYVIDIREEYSGAPAYPPYLKRYNNGHLRWLEQQNWAGKWSTFAAYERLDNIDYHHLELLAESFGVKGRGLAFFKIHNKADHFDRIYDPLKKIWQKKSGQVKAAFDFIGEHQLAMWQWLSDTLEGSSCT